MKRYGSFIHLAIFTLISILFFAGISLASDISNQSRNMLSPFLHINNAVIQHSFNRTVPKLPLISLSTKDMEAYSLDELTEQIITQCKSGNFSLLILNWGKKHLDYQQFIKEAAAVNCAIKHFLSAKDASKAIDPEIFIEKAINLRIEMIEKYQAALSEKGLESIFFIEHALKTAGILKVLMDPPADWFEPLLDDERKKALLRKCVRPLVNSEIYDPSMDTPRIVATWGCSTQCDHCDGAAVIEIESFPWIWAEESQTLTPRHISRINLASYHNDHFRDYYDIIYDKDASHLYELLNRDITSTSGFAIGSVGERALKRILKKDKMGLFQISFAPSAWMRSVIKKQGVQGYIKYLKNIETLFSNAGASDLFQYAIFNFIRIDDPPDYIAKIIEFCSISNRNDISGKIHVSGRYAQFEATGEIDSSRTKSELNRLSDYPNEQDKRNTHFLFDDLDKYFLLPDGQLIRGIEPDENTLMRSYETIQGVESIGRRKISCLMCQNPACNGSQNSNCIGRSNVFKYHGLSKSGGFQKKPLLIEQAI